MVRTVDTRRILSTILVAQEEQSVQCVCVCVCVSPNNNFWTKLSLSSTFSKMIHVDQVRSSRSQGENVPFRLRIHVLNMHSESRDADGRAKRAHNAYTIFYWLSVKFFVLKWSVWLSWKGTHRPLLSKIQMSSFKRVSNKCDLWV